jgi:hypothetical protein
MKSAILDIYPTSIAAALASDIRAENRTHDDPDLSTSTALIALVSLFGIGMEAKFCQNAAQTVGQVAFHAYEQATDDFNLFKVSPSVY